MPIVPLRPTTSTPAVDLGHQNRLAVQRSPAFELLNGNLPTPTVMGAVAKLLDPPAIAQVRSALRSTNIEMTPGTADVEAASLTADLMRFGAIAAGGWTASQKAEWQKAVLDELAPLPFLLVKPALAEARRRVQFPSALVTWVYEQIEAKLKRLQTEKACYERLLEIADARAQ